MPSSAGISRIVTGNQEQQVGINSLKGEANLLSPPQNVIHPPISGAYSTLQREAYQNNSIHVAYTSQNESVAFSSPLPQPQCPSVLSSRWALNVTTIALDYAYTGIVVSPFSSQVMPQQSVSAKKCNELSSIALPTEWHYNHLHVYAATTCCEHRNHTTSGRLLLHYLHDPHLHMLRLWFMVVTIPAIFFACSVSLNPA